MAIEIINGKPATGAYPRVEIILAEIIPTKKDPTVFNLHLKCNLQTSGLLDFYFWINKKQQGWDPWVQKTRALLVSLFQAVPGADLPLEASAWEPEQMLAFARQWVHRLPGFMVSMSLENKPPRNKEVEQWNLMFAQNAAVEHRLYHDIEIIAISPADQRDVPAATQTPTPAGYTPGTPPPPLTSAEITQMKARIAVAEAVLAEQRHQPAQDEWGPTAAGVDDDDVEIPF